MRRGGAVGGADVASVLASVSCAAYSVFLVRLMSLWIKRTKWFHFSCSPLEVVRRVPLKEALEGVCVGGRGV